MNTIEQFHAFAADFELCVHDDRWARLKKYFAPDATYVNLGGPDPKCHGRDAILAFFKSDVDNTDRKFDTRTLTATSDPVADGNRLFRRWRCTYTLAGAPDLVVTGESRYLFDDGLIKELEIELTGDTNQVLEQWMRDHGNKL
jgi:hypothetical protein